MVYVDIHNFKLVNDLFGHKMGDELMYEVKTAQRMMSALRVGQAIRLEDVDLYLISKAQAEKFQAIYRPHWPSFSLGLNLGILPILTLYISL